jgi:hypothetical protein
MTFKVTETTLTGIVRAEISFARDRGNYVEPELALALAKADLLELPDDTMFVPAIDAASRVPTRLDDPASIAFTREVALQAGYGKLSTTECGQA